MEFGNYSTKIPGTNVTVDDVVAKGLFRYDPMRKKLECPFIWIYMMARHRKHDILWRMLRITAENSTSLYSASEAAPGSRMWWQDWERFAMGYRALRSASYANTPIRYSELHRGASLNLTAKQDVEIVPMPLKMVSSSYQVNTMKPPDIIQCEMENVDITACRHIILNGESALAGDSFCCVRLGEGGYLREIHQCKLVSGGALTRTIMEAERKKAARDEDYFLIFSTYDTVALANIPPMTGIVVRENFRDYFGPFFSRAVFLASINRPPY